MNKQEIKKCVGKLAVAATITLLSITSSTLYGQDTPVVIQNQRELFVDSYLGLQLKNIEHRLATPIVANGGMTFDKPWEGNTVLYFTIFHDGRHYKMYYRGKGRIKGELTDVTCYAESDDGIEWKRPNLRIHEVNGTLDNNVILVNEPFEVSHNFAAMYDGRPGVPQEERYKAVGGSNHPGKPGSGLNRMVSSDGIHWRLYADTTELFADFALDSHNILTWLPKEQCYAIYLRTYTKVQPGNPFPPKGSGGIRTIARSVSKDFIHWTKPEVMDFGDTKKEHLYTNNTQPYYRAPHILFAMPSRYSPGISVLSPKEAEDMKLAETHRKGASDAVLMTSRGGNTYERKFMQTFVRPGFNRRNWGARSNAPATGLLQTSPTETSFYVSRGYASPKPFIERMVVRTDGFASLHAGYEAGSATTKPIVLKGSSLSANFSTSTTGYVKVVILDEAGNELAGFGEKDALPLIGDRIDQEVKWMSGKSIKDIRDKTVRIKFVIKDADLYSFYVSD